MRRNLLILASALVLVALPGLAGAEEPTTTTVLPTTSVPPSTTTVAASPEAPAGETTTSVGDEAAYRAALVALSADVAGPHTIDLTADITVDDGTDPTYTGTEDLVVDGHGFTLDATGTSRLLVVDSATDATLTLSAVRMVNGLGVGDGGAVQVLQDSPVTITGSTFETNTAAGSGGAVAVARVVDIAASTFRDNRATTGDGGALAGTSGAVEASVVDSTFDGNVALAGDGGAIGPMGSSNDNGVQRSTLVGNRARRGGAAFVVGEGAFVNSTIVDNVATVSGGGIQFGGALRGALWFDTLTGNAAPVGANLYHDGGDLLVLFNIIAEPVGGTNCVITNGSNTDVNHIDDGSCREAPSGSPELGPLADNGGPTLTRLPLPGSPVIDAVPVDLAPQVIETCTAQFLHGVDQRGEPRLVDGDHEDRISQFHGPRPVAADCDQGAVEAAFVAVPDAPTGPVAGGPAFTG